MAATPGIFVDGARVPALDIRDGQTIALDGGWTTTRYLPLEALTAERLPLVRVAYADAHAEPEPAAVASAVAAALVAGLATPQIRNMATIGGNLCQDVRCWYYRYPRHLGGPIDCSRKGLPAWYAVSTASITLLASSSSHTSVGPRLTRAVFSFVSMIWLTVACGATSSST